MMLSGLMLGAPPSLPGDDAPTPKLEKGLEVIWQGTLAEEILRPNVRARRFYEIETRLYVWDVCSNGSDVALFTSIKLKPDLKTTTNHLLPEKGKANPPAIVRLEMARVDPHGKLTLLTPDSIFETPEKRRTALLPLLPMEGLPTFEPNLFVEFPTQKMKMHQAWDVVEEKRPMRTLRIEAFEPYRGTPCCRLTAIQRTADWENEHIDLAAWRRAEVIRISTKRGFAVRLERTIEKRDPQSGQIGFRSTLTYEQVGYMRYVDRFGEDRRDEVMAAAQFTAMFEQLVAEIGKNGPNPFEPLLQRIEQHTVTHISSEAVPYRQAIISVKRKAQAAARGDIPPQPTPPETITETYALVNGKPAPEITLTNIVNGQSTPLSKLHGRPAVLLYYQPTSGKTAEPVLRYAESLYTQFGGKAFILPMAIGPNDLALQQRNDLKLNVNVLAGREVCRHHGIESAPYFAVIDENGIVRKATLGWSDENADAIRDELEKWLK